MANDLINHKSQFEVESDLTTQGDYPPQCQGAVPQKQLIGMIWMNCSLKRNPREVIFAIQEVKANIQYKSACSDETIHGIKLYSVRRAMSRLINMDNLRLIRNPNNYFVFPLPY